MANINPTNCCTKKRFFTLTLLFFLYYASFGLLKAKANDSYFPTEPAKDSIALADQYTDLAWHFLQISEPDSFFLYAEKGLAVSKQNNYKEGIITSLNHIGFYYYVISNFALTIQNCEEALRKSKEIGYLLGEATALNYIGLTYINQGIYSKSLEYHHKFLEISKKLKDTTGIADANLNIGLAYLNQNILGKAMIYYKKALALHQVTHDSIGISYALNNIGVIYQEINELEKALEYFHKTLVIREKIKDLRGSIYVLRDLGKIYTIKKEYNKALTYLYRALDVANLHQYKFEAASVYTSIGETYQLSGDTSKSNSFLLKGLAVAGLISALEEAERASKLLYKNYYQQGDYQSAFKYQTEYFIYNDSLKREEQAKSMALMESKLEIERKEAKNQLLANENLVKDLKLKKQNILFITILIIVGTLIGLVYMLQHMNMQSKKTNVILQHRNEEIYQQKEELLAQSEELARKNKILAELNEEKDSLVGVIAHDLRSPLNQVKGFAELIPLVGIVNDDQLFYLKLTNEVVESGNRLIAELLEVCSLDSFNNTFNISPFDLKDFIKEVVSTYVLPAKKKEIKLHLETDAQDMIIHSDKDALRRILDNLLSNAIKFSPAKKDIYVKIKFHKRVTQIVVKDEGPGITEQDRKRIFKKFQKLSARPTGGENSTGLGLYIVKKLIEGLGGTIALESKHNKGAEFKVKLPTSRN